MTSNQQSPRLADPLYGYTSSTNDDMKHFLLAGDVGGTNIRLAIYDCAADSECKEPIYHKEYLNSVYITDKTKTFHVEVIEPFLCNWYHHFTGKEKGDKHDDEAGADISIFSCFAVAGPVKNNCASMTNLKSAPVEGCVGCSDMVIKFCGDAIANSNLKMLTLIKTCLIVNDFQGQGYGVLDLDHDTEVLSLTPNSKALMDPNGPKVCIGAGTGLGECYLTPNGDGSHTCFASEGGHVDFTPRSPLQYQLCQHLQKKFNEPHRISIERVFSGKGLANIYEFLAKTFPERITKAVHDEFLKAKDMQGKVVGVNANVAPTCGLCVEAMEIMMQAYGAEVGNCGLTFIPTGGLYVAGGLTPKNINFIAKKDGDRSAKDTVFGKSYWDKGRVSGLLETVPLFAVMEEDMGLRGARVCAELEYKKHKSNY